jgi:hypothetical protein
MAHKRSASDEAERLMEEALSYLKRGMPEGVAWRLADALYWIKQELDASLKTDIAGAHRETGLGNMLSSTQSRAIEQGRRHGL